MFQFSNNKMWFLLLFFILIFSIFLLFQKITGKPIEGFTTVLLLIGLTSSFNIITIGLVGEYVQEFIQR